MNTKRPERIDRGASCEHMFTPGIQGGVRLVNKKGSVL